MSNPKKTVLHIDDDEDDRSFVKEAIESIEVDLELIQIDNGEKGLAYLKRATDTGSHPCLILLDLNMPGMDGKTVLMEIKKDPSLENIPLVIFTTSSSLLDKTFAARQNVDLITKPPTFSALMPVLKKILTTCGAD